MEEFNLEEFKINFGINNQVSDWEIFSNEYPFIGNKAWVVLKKNRLIKKLSHGEEIFIKDNGITVHIPLGTLNNLYEI